MVRAFQERLEGAAQHSKKRPAAPRPPAQAALQSLSSNCRITPVAMATSK